MKGKRKERLQTNRGKGDIDKKESGREEVERQVWGIHLNILNTAIDLILTGRWPMYKLDPTDLLTKIMIIVVLLRG